MPDLSSLLQEFGPSESSGGPTTGSIMGFVEHLKAKEKRQKLLDTATEKIYQSFEGQTDPQTGAPIANPIASAADWRNAGGDQRQGLVGGFIKSLSLRQAMDEIAQRKQQFDLGQQLGALNLATGKQRLADLISQKQDEDAAQTALANVPGQANPATLQAALLAAGPQGQTDAASAGGPATPEDRINALLNYRGPGNPLATRTGDNVLRTLEMLTAARARNAEQTPLNFGASDVIDLAKITGNPALRGRFVTRQTPHTFTQPFDVGLQPGKDQNPLPAAPEGMELHSVTYDKTGRPVASFRPKGSDAADIPPKPSDDLLSPGTTWNWKGPKQGWVSGALPTGTALATALKPGTAAAPAAAYKSAADVKAALKAGKLTKEAAVKILREQFGFQ